MNKWGDRYPEIAAHVSWLAITWEQDHRLSAAATHFRQALDAGFEQSEPRLTLMACESLLATAGLDAAVELAEHVLSNANTDDAYTDLNAWLTWIRQAAAKQTPAPRCIVKRRLARPEGRRNPNPYAVLSRTTAAQPLSTGPERRP